MVATIGLTGLRPDPARVPRIASPPYDVIKPDTPLEKLLAEEPSSLFHIILGDQPAAARDRMVADGLLVEDDEPAYYVYEQTWPEGRRTGVFVAAEVSPYDAKQIIRHEKTFDDKVKGRIALRRATGLHIGPVFVLTRAPIGSALERAKQEAEPIYDFTSAFGGFSELEGIRNKVWRVPEQSETGRALQSALATEPLYIADGHHRYHASLLNEQTHFLCYVTEEAVIQAYNRVINGVRRFSEIEGLTHESVAVTNRLQTVDARVEVGLPYDARTIPSDMLVKLAHHILKSAQANAEDKGVANTTLVIGDGDPAARILACAEQENSDCIILGSRGLSNIQALFEGSVSRKVSNRAACTIIAVR